MYSLNHNQIALIEQDVAKANISLSHLADELIDHISCEVESELLKGLEFSEAYQKIKKQAGLKTLQNIQENTQFLIDKNYRIMKTIMKITGNIALVLLSLGTVLKIYHLPFASVALLVGFALICFFFFPAAIYANYKNLKERNQAILHISIFAGGVSLMLGILFKIMHWPFASILLFSGWTLILFLFIPLLLSTKLKSTSSGKLKTIYILGAIAIFVFEVGTLFKFMHLPGASILLISGAILLVSVFLPMYSFHEFKQTGNITSQYIFTIVATMFLVLLTALLSLNVSKNIISSFERDTTNANHITQYLKNKHDQNELKSLPATDSTHYVDNSKFIQLHQQTENLIKSLHNIKTQLVMAVDQIDESTAINRISNPDLLEHKDNSVLVYKFLFDQDGQSLIKTFKNDIEDFKATAKSLANANPELSNYVDKILNTSDIHLNGTLLSWEDYTFTNKLLINSLTVFSNLEANIYLAENKVLNNKY